jgi:hypothetical protein
MRKEALVQWCLSRPIRCGLLIFLLAALPRWGYGFYVQSHTTKGFAGEMERAAASLATQGDIADTYGPGSGPSAHVAPLYAYLLAALYRIFGLPDTVGRWAQVTLAVSVSATCIALLPALGQRLRLRPGVGYAAALLAAISPLNLWIETSGSWEQPVAAMCLFGLLYSAVTLHDCGWNARGLVLGTGLLVGTAALLSPVLLPAVIIVLCSELCLQVNSRKRVAVAVCLIAAISVACMAPWMVRNYVKLGGLVAFRSNLGLELWIGNNAQTNGSVSDSDWITSQCHPYCSRLAASQLKSVGELAYMRGKQQEALAWIAANPGRFAVLTARRWLTYWLPLAASAAPLATAVILKDCAFTVVGSGSLVGLVWAFVAGHRYRWLFLATLAGPSLIYMVTHVDPRYRYSTFLLMVLMGCQGIWWVMAAGWRRLGPMGRLRRLHGDIRSRRSLARLSLVFAVLAASQYQMLRSFGERHGVQRLRHDHRFTGSASSQPPAHCYSGCGGGPMRTLNACPSSEA